jgi:hypothetical protein
MPIIVENEIVYNVIECLNGDIFWYFNSKLHRIGGPAVELHNESKGYILNGKLHRAGSSAVKCADGYKEYYLYGIQYTEKKYNEKITQLNQELRKNEIVENRFSQILNN